MTNAPLHNVHVIELAGIGPVPYATHVLSSLGAKITRVERPGAQSAIRLPVENRGKDILTLDLSEADGRDRILHLIKQADVLIEGNRPGVAERLRLGPKDCQAVNPKLRYARMTGWGQTGPWANMAGHDINYIGLSGALHAMGEADKPPTPPINFVGDYGGGSMFIVTAILAALYERHSTNTGQVITGQVIDCAIVDGTLSMCGIIQSLSHIGMWTPKRSTNLLDGSRPYYKCYTTKDGGFMAVGCLEPKFYALMLSKLDLNPSEFGGQMDAGLWPNQIEILAGIFASQTRLHWEQVFDGSDACVTPVLRYAEVSAHKHMKARRELDRQFPPLP